MIRHGPENPRSFLTVRLETHYNKDTILQGYINTVYLDMVFMVFKMPVYTILINNPVI